MFRRFRRVKALTQSIEDRLADCQITVARIGAFNDCPGRLGCTGLTQHALGNLTELVVHLVVLPIGRGNTPAGFGILFQLFQTFFLPVPGEVQPEFQDQGSFVAEHLFKADNPLQLLIKFGILDLPIHVIDQRAGIPCTDEDADCALGRQNPPVSVHTWAFKLLIGQIPQGVGLYVARIHPLVEDVDGLTFAGTVHPGHQNNYRELLCLQQIELSIQQRFTKPGDLPLPFCLTDLVANLRGFKHASPLTNDLMIASI